MPHLYGTKSRVICQQVRCYSGNLFGLFAECMITSSYSLLTLSPYACRAYAAFVRQDTAGNALGHKHACPKRPATGHSHPAAALEPVRRCPSLKAPVACHWKLCKACAVLRSCRVHGADVLQVKSRDAGRDVTLPWQPCYTRQCSFCGCMTKPLARLPTPATTTASMTQVHKCFPPLLQYLDAQDHQTF